MTSTSTIVCAAVVTHVIPITAKMRPLMDPGCFFVSLCLPSSMLSTHLGHRAARRGFHSSLVRYMAAPKKGAAPSKSAAPQGACSDLYCGYFVTCISCPAADAHTRGISLNKDGSNVSQPGVKPSCTDTPTATGRLLTSGKIQSTLTGY